MLAFLQIFVIFLALFTGNFVHADEVPLIYSRSTFILHIAGENLADKKIAPKDEKTKEPPVKTTPKSYQFEVEIRPESTIRAEWFNSSIGTKRGHAFMATQEIIAPFPLAGIQAYEPMDVLLVRPNGKIAVIIPEIILGNFQEELQNQEHIKAAIFLSPGLVKKLGVRLGDSIEHEIFVPTPQVIQ